MGYAITSKGQVTIPKHVRTQMGVGAGDLIDFKIDPDGSVRLVADTLETYRDRVARLSRGFDTMGMDSVAYVRWLRGE